MMQCDPTSATVTAVINRGFVTRWDKLSAGIELHSDLFNVTLVLMPGVSLQIRLTKALLPFYMMSKEADSKTTFK